MPVEVKEIQVGYLYSPYFKDLYQYLSQNKLPSSKSAIRKLETLSEKYVLLDSLLFRISPEKQTAVLAIPEMCADKIITLYHKSLFAGDQGIICSSCFTTNEIMKYHCRQSIDSQCGPITEFVTEYTLHTNINKRSDIIFIFFLIPLPK